MCTGPGKAPQRDYGAEMKSTLAAETATAPDLYASEATYQPKYAALGATDFDTLMNGAGGAKGILGVYANDIAPAEANAQVLGNNRTRTGDVRDLQTLGPAAVAAIRGANPQQEALLNELNAQAMQELGAGAKMDPAMEREAQQSVRSAQASRGFGLGPADAMEEAMFTGSRALQLRQARQAFGMQMAGVNQAANVDPMMAVVGRPSTAVNSGIVGQGASAGMGNKPYLFDPQNPYASDVYNTNLNANASYGIANSNSRDAMLGSIISMVGGMAGGAMKGCWVARAVFGEANPQWRAFRYWLFEYAPLWFLKLYLARGEAFAGWIADKPRVKGWVRGWMEKRVAGVWTEFARRERINTESTEGTENTKQGNEVEKGGE